MSVCTLSLRAIRTAVRSHLSQISAPATARAHTDGWFWTCHTERAFTYLQHQFSRLSHAHHQQHHQLAGHPRPDETSPFLSFRHWPASNVPSPILHQQLHGATPHCLSGSNPVFFMTSIKCACGSKECTIRALMVPAITSAPKARHVWP